LSYPTSCSPQAWAAAAPLLLVRTLLRLDPWISGRQVWFAPAWPAELGTLKIENLPLAGYRAEVAVDMDGGRLSGLPEDIRIIDEPRPVTTGTESRR